MLQLSLNVIWQMRNSSWLHCFQKSYCGNFTIEQYNTGSLVKSMSKRLVIHCWEFLWVSSDKHPPKSGKISLPFVWLLVLQKVHKYFYHYFDYIILAENSTFFCMIEVSTRASSDFVINYKSSPARKLFCLILNQYVL